MEEKKKQEDESRKKKNKSIEDTLKQMRLTLRASHAKVMNENKFHDVVSMEDQDQGIPIRQQLDEAIEIILKFVSPELYSSLNLTPDLKKRITPEVITIEGNASNGFLEQQLSKLNGQLHGACYSMSSDGTLKYDEMLNNQHHGLSTVISESTGISKSLQYRHGKLEGFAFLNQSKIGHMMAVFENNQLHGLLVLVNEDFVVCEKWEHGVKKPFKMYLPKDIGIKTQRLQNLSKLFFS